MARTYLDARNRQLVNVAATPSQPVPLTTAMSATAARTDEFLSQQKALLLRHKQQFTSTDIAVTTPKLEMTADGRSRLSFTEHTRRFFDQKLDPQAPRTTEQVVERVFVFRADRNAWRIDDVRRASDLATIPMNDAPGPVEEEVSPQHAPAINTPEYNYGIKTLSATDQAEDQQPQPPDNAVEATAPEDGAPNTEPEKSDEPAAASMGPTGYCYSCMVSYAKRWWYTRNPAYRSFANDCTNFVSQSLKAGGWTHDYGWYWSGSNWWYNSLNQTYTWGAAENWSYFAPKRTTRLYSVWYLLSSDVLLADWNRDGNISHAMLVTKKTSSMVYITQHTDNYVDRPLSLVISGNRGAAFYAYRT